MFASSRRVGHETWSRCQFWKSRCKISILDDFSKCLSTWNRSSKHVATEKWTGSQMPKRWSSSQIPEGLSYINNPGATPLIDDKTGGQLFSEAAEQWPNRECVISSHQNVRLTYSEVLRRGDKLAAGMLKLGLKKGDRVGLWGPNDIEWFIAFVALTRAGLIMVGINPAYQQSEIDYCIQKTAAKAVIAPNRFKTQDYTKMLLSAKERCPSLEHIIIYSEDHLTGTRRFADVESLASNSEVQAISAMQSEISPYDGCNIQFTSGTTGNPKATLISHRSFINNSRQGMRRSGMIDDHHKFCLNVPLFHAFSMVMGQFSMFQAGATMVLQAPSFNPKSSLEAIVREKCTACYGTPTMWINMLELQKRLQAPIEPIKVAVTGGSTISPDILRKITTDLRVERLQNIYGLTETTAIAFQSLPGESSELTQNTVGHISDHVEAMVVDENGKLVPFGSPGELWVRGYLTMIKYWGDEENTRKTLTEDGWLKTGDQFCLRADGYGNVVGRLKDMIIRGGENIFPKEIEHFLESHPAILEAHVVGVHDDVFGEEICACVRLNADTELTQQELKSYAKGKIAHFKIPRYIEYLENFPRTATGKIQKYQLRKDLITRGVVPATPERR